VRVAAGLVLVVAAAIVLLSVLGALPWWEAGFPLLVAWMSIISLAMYWLDKRGAAD
jgi:hypothetical protein